MNIIRDVAKELISMFMADAVLALSILGLIALNACVIKFLGTPLLAGGFLMAGCLIILVSAVCREAKKRSKNPSVKQD